MQRQRGLPREGKRKPLPEEKWEAGRTSEDTWGLSWKDRSRSPTRRAPSSPGMTSDRRLRRRQAGAAGEREECRTGSGQDGANQKWGTCSLLSNRVGYAESHLLSFFRSSKIR